MPTNWTDNPVTTSTPIKAVHINELRDAVNSLRQSVHLDQIKWIDQPVGSATPIKGAHFAQVRSAIQDLWLLTGMGGLPAWTNNESPEPGSPMRASQMNDLRGWINAFESSSGAVDPQGITSLLCDPDANAGSGAIVDSEWRDDAFLLKPDGERLLIRAKVSARSDNFLPLSRYANAIGVWAAGGFSVALVLPREFYLDPDPGEWNPFASPNGVLNLDGGLSNTFIEAYSNQAASLVSFLGNSVDTYWIWNEPNLDGSIPSNVPPSPGHEPAMSPQNAGALLYTTARKMKAFGAKTIYAGSMNLTYPGTSLSDVSTYFGLMYDYLLTGKGLRRNQLQWDALSLNVTGIPPRNWFEPRLTAIYSSLISRGIFMPMVLGEWGTQPENINPQEAEDAYKMYLELISSKIMYFFSHQYPVDGMGTTNFTFAQGGSIIVPEKDGDGNVKHTSWYPILQDLYESAP